MNPKIERALISPPVFIGGGAAAVVLATLLTWVNLSAQLNSRQPVPSPDGKYFAYFDQLRRSPDVMSNPYELIVSRAGGQEVARFSNSEGTISWSNAGDLAVINAERNHAALIANSDGRFLQVNDLHLGRGTEPRWSTDGTKIAYVLPEPKGDAIAIYDFLQTRSTVVQFPEGFQLIAPLLLFWSPGGGALFFLNSPGHAVVLERLDFQDGKLQPLARGTSRWRDPSSGKPRLSSDGMKVYLPPPLHSVINAQTGQTLWALPAASQVSWSLWSAEGHQIYYLPGNGLGTIIAHELANSTDRVILNHAEPGGFLSADGEIYFYPLLQPRPSAETGPSLTDWLKSQWGWRQEDVGSPSGIPLGRALLLPWAETRDGLILMSRDDYTRVRYGLYDPHSGILDDFVFPTDWEDLFHNAQSQALFLASVLLYGVLAFIVYLKRTGSPPARAFYILSLTLMVVFASLGAHDTLLSLETAPAPWNVADLTLRAQRWHAHDSRLALLELAMAWFDVALVLVPPVFLHFAFVFPEGNRFLADRKGLRRLLYGAACLPLIELMWKFAVGAPQPVLSSNLMDLFYVAGGVVVITALSAFLYNHRHPPDRRALDQLRWAIYVLPVPLAALVARGLLRIFF